MASILSLGTKKFRTRNPARDAGTDMDRFMSVRRSIAAVIENATQERQGLQQRVDLYYAQATSLLDNSAEFSLRADTDEQAIQEAERNAAAATQRIKHISIHMEQLSKLLAVVEEAAKAAVSART